MSDADTVKSQSRDERIGQILNDYLDRKARGEAETQDLLLAKHPDLADELRSHLDLIGEMRPQRATLQDLIAQGLLAPCDEPGYPARLGAYKTSRIIGRGGMGIVLEAYEQSLDRSVALKILRPILAEDEAALARFKREAQAAAALRHPNIVTVHAIGREGSAHYLAMEYVEGPALGDVIREQGPLPAGLTRHVFHQLLSGLAAAHQAGLIHRDIKSSNILLDEPRPSARADAWHDQAGLGRAEQPSPLATGKDQLTLRSDGSPPMPPDAAAGAPSAPDVAAGGSSSPDVAAGAPAGRCRCCSSGDWLVKIADFGLARMLSARTRMTMTGSVLGTPEYMSPEQARGDERLDHRTDLYSAGVVLYEMLTGRTPFKADTPSAVIHRILHDDPPDPRTMSKDADPQLASLALRLMAKRPEDRFDSVGEAIAALDAGERIRSLEGRRRMYRHGPRAALVVAVLFLACWTVRHVTLRAPSIVEVRVDPDLRYRINCVRGEKTEWERFFDFAPDVELTGAVKVDVEGGRSQIVVAGSKTALGPNGECLIALDASRREQWKTPLHTELGWPDCAAPSRLWPVSHILVGEVDRMRGEEVVVVAHDPNEYPTRVSIIHPRTGDVRRTFWHFGQLREIGLAEGFFEGGRPAIWAYGQNNKLDGFGDPPPQPYHTAPGEDQPRTSWSKVGVVMVLDPETMDGLGPPRVNPGRVPETSKLSAPHAYAFLDWPVGDEPPQSAQSTAGQPRTKNARPRRRGIESLQRAVPREQPAGTTAWFQIGISSELELPFLQLDRNLGLVDVWPVSIRWRGTKEATKAYWDECWRPIIQNGRYLPD